MANPSRRAGVLVIAGSGHALLHTAKPSPLTDPTTTVNHNLLKAEALAWVLAEPLDPDHPTAETLALMAQLIREAREAHNAQWERLTDPKRED